MASENTNVDTNVTAVSTQQKRPATVVPPSDPKRRPPTRSNVKTATDLLLDEGRIGRATKYPSKKRRYIKLKMDVMMPQLVDLYSFLFNYRFQFFRHLAPPGTATTQKTHATNFAIVYLSHWLSDLYRINRTCLEDIDPAAFQDKFSVQVGTHSNVYDNFLSVLNAHLRPTHITTAVSDSIYIPLFTNIKGEPPVLSITWDKLKLDANLFHSILEIMMEKKVVKMTPLSSDLLGRPSWLFDWSPETTAFAWFPQEGNYTDEDVAVAFVIGDACSPKLSLADIDEWKYTDFRPTIDTASSIAAYQRATPRKWFGNSEFRVIEIEEVHHPNFKEDDPSKRAADNHGPLQVMPNVLNAPNKRGSSSTDPAEADDIVTETDVQSVPPSPSRATRSAWYRSYRRR